MKSFPNTLNKSGKTLKTGSIISSALTTYQQYKYASDEGDDSEGILYNVDRDEADLLNNVRNLFKNAPSALQRPVKFVAKNIIGNNDLDNIYYSVLKGILYENTIDDNSNVYTEQSKMTKVYSQDGYDVYVKDEVNPDINGEGQTTTTTTTSKPENNKTKKGGQENKVKENKDDATNDFYEKNVKGTNWTVEKNNGETSYGLQSTVVMPDDVKKKLENKSSSWLHGYEDPFKIPNGILAVEFNKYRYLFKTGMKSFAGKGIKKNKDGEDESIEEYYTSIPGAQSLFSDYNGMLIMGISENTPLLNDPRLNGIIANKTLTTFEIRTAMDKYQTENQKIMNDAINDANALLKDTSNATVEETDKTAINVKGEQGAWDNQTATTKKPIQYASITANSRNFGNETTILTLNKLKTRDRSDCSIKTLVELSKNKREEGNWSSSKNNELGIQRYSYADFMYCAELGQISNNHLITLRRFSTPVSDNLTNDALSSSSDNGFGQLSDIGRMVTWFGTEDNKLESILSYNVKATWRSLKAEIEKQNSTEGNNGDGLIASLVHLFNPRIAKLQNAGVKGYGTLNILGWLGNNNVGTTLFGTSNPIAQVAQNMFSKTGNVEDKTFVDPFYEGNYKVYEPINTVQEASIYEGKLESTFSFSLTFKYKLRAYSQVNGKSAFLDLLANILNVCYKRGQFWGGDRVIVGGVSCDSQWAKINTIVNGFVDGQFNELSGFLGTIKDIFKSGNLGGILGAISQCVTGLANTILTGGTQLSQAIQNLAVGTKTGASTVERGKEFLNSLGSLWNKMDIRGMVKNAMGNSIGRPQIYAWHSLLTGEPVGTWHVTIGNPRNPIATIGDLIIEDTQITHMGPLGVDDFPTELKVVVKLKRSRSNDKNELERIYTQGRSTLHNPLGNTEDIFQYIGSPQKYINRTMEIIEDGNQVS